MPAASIAGERDRDLDLTAAAAVDLPEATVFETGVNRWHTYEQWPPKNATPKKMFLDNGHTLTFTTQASEKEQYDEVTRVTSSDSSRLEQLIDAARENTGHDYQRARELPVYWTRLATRPCW